ncbi:hypothetical protein QCA50_015119 [Cerrena zonata]|uniref:FAD-binding PCMH-type domain-containing protein n=1 Tax=Cerrena zonata TaxID=2478898 RepID=A0AAW0FNQ9_9APHY
MSNRLPRTLLLSSSRRFSNTHALSGQAVRITRQNSTVTSQGSGSKARSPFIPAILLLVGAGAGWTLSQTWESGSPSVPKNAQRYLTSPGLNDQYGSVEDFQLAIKALHSALPGDVVSTDPDVLEVHGFSENDYHPGSSPSVVVFPESTEDVVKIVKIANTYRMPVIPYSGATSLEGHYRAPSIGAICVDMTNMDQVLEIHEADSDLVCQPGAKWMDINAMLKKKGIPLFFPIDPAPGATIGGMVSTGCSGTNAVRYGTAKGEWFLNVTVVLPSGEVIKTRRRSRKSSAGFDTTKLFVGAEGTLGIITEVTIRLAPLLPTNVAVVHFPDVRKQPKP